MTNEPQQNFQPQVGNTTNGPHLHTYIPQADGTIVIGGVAYLPAVAGGVAATTVPIGVQTAVPVAIQQSCSPYVQFPSILRCYINHSKDDYPPE